MNSSSRFSWVRHSFFSDRRNGGPTLDNNNPSLAAMMAKRPSDPPPSTANSRQQRHLETTSGGGPLEEFMLPLQGDDYPAVVTLATIPALQQKAAPQTTVVEITLRELHLPPQDPLLPPPKVRFQDFQQKQQLPENSSSSPPKKPEKYEKRPRRLRSLSWKRKKKAGTLRTKRVSSSFDLSESTEFYSSMDFPTPSDSSSSSPPVSKCHQSQKGENEVMHSFGGQNHLKSPFNVLTSSTEESKKGPLKLYPSGLLTRQPSHCGELNKAKFRCFFGRIHAVTGSKATLVFYICLSVLGIIFGEMAATVWALIPLIVIPLTVHSFRNRSPKFIIPLLIVTLVQSFVCILMSFIVVAFSLLNFEKLRILTVVYLRSNPSTTIIVVSSVTIFFLCILLAFIFLWQVTALSSCIRYYDHLHALEKAQAAALASRNGPLGFLTNRQTHLRADGGLNARPKVSTAFDPMDHRQRPSGEANNLLAAHPGGGLMVPESQPNRQLLSPTPAISIDQQGLVTQTTMVINDEVSTAANCHQHETESSEDRNRSPSYSSTGDQML